jgi:hypothetical protein
MVVRDISGRDDVLLKMRRQYDKSSPFLPLHTTYEYVTEDEEDDK